MSNLFIRYFGAPRNKKKTEEKKTMKYRTAASSKTVQTQVICSKHETSMNGFHLWATWKTKKKARSNIQIKTNAPIPVTGVYFERSEPLANSPSQPYAKHEKPLSHLNSISVISDLVRPPRHSLIREIDVTNLTKINDSLKTGRPRA